MGLENNNPWVGIWVHPRRTMRAILESDPRRVIIWLAILWGFLSGLSTNGYLWSTQPDNILYRSAIFIIGGLIVGGIMGIFYLYAGGWLFKLTGSWIGGEGSFTDVKSAVGWSFYPFSLAHIFGLLSLAVMPNVWLQSLFGLINVVILIWGVVIFLKLIGEAHRFSAWKALLAWMIGLVLVLVAIMLVALIVPLVSPIFF